MNESKAEKQRYWIALMLDQLSVDTVFEPGRLHITIIPWFVTEAPEAETIATFKQNFSKVRAFKAKIGEQKLFGPRHNVPVNLIVPSDDLSNLEQLALDWFEQLNARWAVKDPHTGGEYLAHIRRRGTKLNIGESININAIYLISAARHEDNQRTVAAKVLLDDKTST